MKKTVFICTLMLGFLIGLQAQNNAKINYQMVIRNSANELLSNASGIEVTLSLLNGEADSTLVYAEKHTVATNANGLVSFLLGDGAALFGDFNDVQWNIGYVKTEIAIPGDSTFVATRPISAVPHALFADDIAEQALLDLLIKNQYMDSTHVANVIDSLNTLIDSLRDRYATLEALICRPAIETKSVSNIGETSATCGGDIVSLCGTSVAERGIVWNTTGTPTLNDQRQAQGSGAGIFSATLTGLQDNTGYHVRAYLISETDTLYGSDIAFRTTATCGNLIVTDIDGNLYNTVKIGGTCWLKENLRTLHFADGGTIAKGVVGSTTTAAAYYYPKNDSANVELYGLLYTWSTAIHGGGATTAVPSNVQGPCPQGWHVPSSGEWENFRYAVISDPDNICSQINGISASVADKTNVPWDYSSTPCSISSTTLANQTGFSARPAGFYDGTACTFFKQKSLMWSTSLYDNNTSLAYANCIAHDVASFTCTSYTKHGAASIRCIKND